jgi:hypothetical protein
MGGINRNPQGLLDFLQTQSGGRNPDFLQESVRPTIDIEPFYWPDRMRGAIEPIALNSGSIEFIEVPEGEVWKVLTIGHVCNTNQAADTNYSVTYGIERLPEQGFNGVELGGFNYHNPAAVNTTQPVHFLQLPIPVLVTSGQRLTITCHRRTSGGLVGTFEVIYVLLNA